MLDGSPAPTAATRSVAAVYWGIDQRNSTMNCHLRQAGKNEERCGARLTVRDCHMWRSSTALADDGNFCGPERGGHDGEQRLQVRRLDQVLIEAGRQRARTIRRLVPAGQRGEIQRRAM